jgi:hypothetical protein
MSDMYLTIGIIVLVIAGFVGMAFMRRKLSRWF